ncbi:MAG: putative small secreted protein [Verrucomicrobiales bacterium]|jgi:predicted small secreted protein
MKIIRQILTISSILAIGALLTLYFSSCNTTQGLGEDIQHLGGEIQQEAAEHTRY